MGHYDDQLDATQEESYRIRGQQVRVNLDKLTDAELGFLINSLEVNLVTLMERTVGTVGFSARDRAYRSLKKLAARSGEPII